MRNCLESNLIIHLSARLGVKFKPLWRNRTGRIWTKLRRHVFLGFSRESKTYVVGIKDRGKLKIIRTRIVKINEKEMYFASNQVNDIAGPSIDVYHE